MIVGIKARWEGLKEWESSENKWQRDVINQVIEELERTAFRIERDAKLNAPVDTGELRKSIGTNVNKRRYSIKAEVGTDLDYSDIVEFGAVNQRAQPYLIPSFDRNVNDLENSINNILRG